MISHHDYNKNMHKRNSCLATLHYQSHHDYDIVNMNRIHIHTRSGDRTPHTAQHSSRPCGGGNEHGLGTRLSCNVCEMLEPGSGSGIGNKAIS